MGIEKDEMTEAESRRVFARAEMASHEAEERDKQRAIQGGEFYRLDFIRRAAIAYASSLEQIDGDLSEPEVLSLIWADARALWNAKPEDC